MILEHKGIPINYSDIGHGNVTVLLHGFLENSTMWSELIPLFSKSSRIITIDLLGHGDTGCLGYVHTMETMADVVKAVLDYLNVIDVTLIGHSMGGYVALAFAELFPEMVNGLCLLNSTALADSEERQLNRDRAVAAVKQNHKAFISMSVSNLFAPNNRERLAKEIENTKQEALKIPLQGIIAALEGMKIRKDRTMVLNDPSIKKMMIIGRKDPVLEYESLLDQTRYTDVEIVEFEDGHMSHIENNVELSYKLLHFIEK